MTMPHLMNCPHQGEGWCLECVGRLSRENAALRESLSLIEETAHNPADMAPEFIGLPDRYQRLASLLGVMAIRSLQGRHPLEG